MDAKKLGEFISQLRKEQGMTQAELAGKLHVTDKAVSRWERGVGLPDIGNLEALVDALGVSIMELMQCRKMEEQEVKAEEVEQIVSSTFDWVQYEKRAERKRKITAVVLGVIGAVMLFVGVHFLILPGFSLSVIGGADGPTSIFLAGKISPKWPGLSAALGVVCLAVGGWNLFRTRR